MGMGYLTMTMTTMIPASNKTKRQALIQMVASLSLLAFSIFFLVGTYSFPAALWQETVFSMAPEWLRRGLGRFFQYSLVIGGAWFSFRDVRAFRRICGPPNTGGKQE